MLSPLKLFTIIADEALEDKLIKELEQLDIKGYTISHVSGKGLAARKESAWEGQNVRIETIITDKKADRLMELLSVRYFERFSVIAFVSAVEVFRRSKFENN